MESATEAAVHEVAAFGPEWFAVIFGCALIGFLVWKAYPIWQDSRKQKLEIMQEESKARIELERMRESRKAEEEKSREQRDRERSEMEGRWAAQNDRSISTWCSSRSTRRSTRSTRSSWTARRRVSRWARSWPI